MHALVLTWFLLFPVLAFGEPWAASVHWERVNGAGWLLRDVSTSEPVALASDPAQVLSSTQPGVVQGAMERSGDLPVVTVNDRFPEFWAQPSVWNSFQRGPSTFSGLGRDVGPEHWAGRIAADRRASAFDPGQRSRVVRTGVSPQPGPIRYEHYDGGLLLAWAGDPGRVYVLEASDSLSEPFHVIEVFGAVGQGELSISLATTPGGQRFYRIKEVRY
jgi:hypothetical protein